MDNVQAMFANYIENFQAGVRNGHLESSMDVFEAPMEQMLRLAQAIENFYKDEKLILVTPQYKAEYRIKQWIFKNALPLYKQYRELFDFNYPVVVKNPRKTIDAFWSTEEYINCSPV